MSQVGTPGYGGSIYDSCGKAVVEAAYLQDIKQCMTSGAISQFRRIIRPILNPSPLSLSFLLACGVHLSALPSCFSRRETEGSSRRGIYTACGHVSFPITVARCRLGKGDLLSRLFLGQKISEYLHYSPFTLFPRLQTRLPRSPQRRLGDFGSKRYLGLPCPFTAATGGQPAQIVWLPGHPCRGKLPRSSSTRSSFGSRGSYISQRR